MPFFKKLKKKIKEIEEKAKETKREAERGLGLEGPPARAPAEIKPAEPTQPSPPPPSPPSAIMEIENPIGEWEGKFQNYTIMGVNEETLKQQGASFIEKANQIKVSITEKHPPSEATPYEVEVKFDFRVYQPPIVSYSFSNALLTGEMTAEGELRAEGTVVRGSTLYPEESVAEMPRIFRATARRAPKTPPSTVPVELVGKVTRLGKKMTNKLTGIIQMKAPDETQLDARELEKHHVTPEQVEAFKKSFEAYREIMIKLPFTLVGVRVELPFHEVAEEEFWRNAKEVIRKGARMDPKLMKQKVDESRKKYPPAKDVPGYPEYKYVGRFIVENAMPKYWDPEVKWEDLPDEKMVVVGRSETVVEKGMPKRDVIIIDHYIRE